MSINSTVVHTWTLAQEGTKPVQAKSKAEARKKFRKLYPKQKKLNPIKF